MTELKGVIHYYLPYKLRCNAVNDEYFEPQINKELYRIETGRTEKLNIYNYWYIVGDIECQTSDIKPILHPLSKLTEEIEHEGKKFTPLKKLVDDEENHDQLKVENYKNKLITGYKVYHDEFGEVLFISDKNVSVLPFKLFEQLLSWHFDLFGLIESGQAIEK